MSYQSDFLPRLPFKRAHVSKFSLKLISLSVRICRSPSSLL